MCVSTHTIGAESARSSVAVIFIGRTPGSLERHSDALVRSLGALFHILCLLVCDFDTEGGDASWAPEAIK